MKRTHGVSIFAATVLTAAVSISLVACGDDSSSANDNPSNNDAPTAQLPDIPCADTLQIDGHYFGGTKVFYKCEDNKWSYVEEKDIPPGIEVPNFFAEYDKAIWKLNKCTADNEGAVQSAWEGNEKYGGVLYYRCEGGSWVNGNISLTCNTEGVQVGDTCTKTPTVGTFAASNPEMLKELMFVYAGDGVWEEIVSEGDPDSALSHCSAEEEGSYKTIKDTIAVYDNGNVWVVDDNYHCESGEWVKSECRDPQESCSSENDGVVQEVVCSIRPESPKSPKTTWTFRCKDNKWEKLSDEEKRQLDAEKKMAEVEIICNDQIKPEAKLGDVCSITEQGGNVSFGIVIYTLVCYVYTEEGWVAKGSAVMSENTSCEDILNPPADTTPAE